MHPICLCRLPNYPKEVKPLSAVKVPTFPTHSALTAGNWCTLGASFHRGSMGTRDS